MAWPLQTKLRLARRLRPPTSKSRELLQIFFGAASCATNMALQKRTEAQSETKKVEQATKRPDRAARMSPDAHADARNPVLDFAPMAKLPQKRPGCLFRRLRNTK